MFQLTIRTPYEDIYTGEVESLSFTSEEGDMQILDDHASITVTIHFSTIALSETNRDEVYLGRNGIFLFYTEKNEAVLLLNYCEKKSEVNYQTAKEYEEFLAKQLEEGHDLTEFQVLYLRNERIAVQQQMEEIEK